MWSVQIPVQGQKDMTAYHIKSCSVNYKAAQEGATCVRTVWLGKIAICLKSHIIMENNDVSIKSN